MRAAGLRAIDTVVSSTAVLVKSKSPTNPAMVDLIASRIVGVISKLNPLILLFNDLISQLMIFSSCPEISTLPV